MEQSYWVIIPASGKGVRLGGSLPKQYLALHQKPLLTYSLDLFAAKAWVTQVVVAIAKEDNYFAELPMAKHPKITSVTGGETRMQSVINALSYIKTKARNEDWVLVHDAARPALHEKDLSQFIQALHKEAIGGILAMPIRDTIKFVSDNLCIKTMERQHLWHALTPQMFRFDVLNKALADCQALGIEVTDEASALEHKGYHPKMVQARYPNPKLTFEEDLSYISMLLQPREERVE